MYLVMSSTKLHFCLITKRAFKAGFQLATESKSQALELKIWWKQLPDAYDSVVYDRVKIRLSELQTEAEELN